LPTFPSPPAPPIYKTFKTRRHRREDSCVSIEVYDGEEGGKEGKREDVPFLCPESEGKVDEVRVRDELLEESMLHLVWKAVDDEKVSVQVGNVRKMVDDSVKIRQTIQLFP
jgi:hypothetical protein